MGWAVLALILAAQPSPFSSSADGVHGAGYALSVADYNTLPPDLATHTRYLIPYPQGDKQVGNVLAFWLNSLSSQRVIKRPLPIYSPGAKPDEQPALYRIDLRDYGWTPAAWEEATKGYPYGRSGSSNGGLLAVRADWFIAESGDATKSATYYTLLYAGRSARTSAGLDKAGQRRNGAPRNADDFRATWGVDLQGVRTFGVETGAIITSGESIVALHNRVLARAPTILGAYWQTFDANDDSLNRDYVKTLQGFQFDAQEHILSLPNGLHAYLLSNAQGVRQDEAPTNIARDPSLPEGDPRVRTPRSCVTCHGPASGLHPPRSILPDLLKGGPAGRVDLFATKAKQQWLEAFYLTDDGRLLRDDQRKYADAIAACNGLSPKENAEAYGKVLTRYADKLTLRDVAQELGRKEEDVKVALLPTAEGLLGGLVTGTASISRSQFEKDYYGQIITLLNQSKPNPPAKVQEPPRDHPLKPLNFR